MTEPKSPTFADAWIGSAARPDPLVVAEALTDLMTNAQAAWRTALGQAVTPQALPYDPLALGKAIQQHFWMLLSGRPLGPRHFARLAAEIEQSLFAGLRTGPPG